MSEKKKKVPVLRFPGFSGEWEERKLGDVTSKIGSGKTPHGGKNAYKDYGISLIRSQNVNYGTVNFTDAVYIDDETDEEMKNSRVLNGDVLLNITGASIGRSAVYNGFERANVNQHVCIIRPLSDQISSEFIHINLTSNNGQKQIDSSQAGGAREGLNFQQISKLVFLFPEIEEQERIGSFFKQLDHLITLHQRKLSNLQARKKGLLQKMFPKDGELFPELRFPGFRDAWEMRKLNDISEKVTEKNKNREFTETLTNSAEYGILSQNDYFEKEISNEKNIDGYYVVRSDDFVYNPRISNYAPVGPIKRNKLNRTGIMSPLYYVFRTKDIDLIFLEKYFDTVYWHKFMELNGDTGARADRFAIKDAVFKEMPIPYPKLEEQAKIGAFFKQLDDSITLHQRKLDHLQTRKKALLQQLFV